MSESVPAELLEWNRENVVSLATRIRALKNAHKITYIDLITESGLARRDKANELPLAQQRFSRWIQSAESKWRALPREHYELICSYLYSRTDLWQSDVFPESAFRSSDGIFQYTASWLGMESRGVRDLQDNFQGNYTIYRHSLLKPGFIVIGSLDIWHDKLSDSVKTRERYHVDSSPLTPATSFEFTGYMFRRNGIYRIMAKQIGNDEMQTIFIPHVVAQGGTENARHIIRMHGVVSDVQSGEYYCTRICFVRGVPERLETIDAQHLPTELKGDLLAPINLIAGKAIAVF